MTEAQALKFCDRMPLALAAASALFVFSRCRLPALVLQRPALQTTAINQILGKIKLGWEWGMLPPLMWSEE